MKGGQNSGPNPHSEELILASVTKQVRTALDAFQNLAAGKDMVRQIKFPTTIALMLLRYDSTDIHLNPCDP
jgi:hypothetical protein